MITLEALTTQHVRDCFRSGLLLKEIADRLVVIPPGKHAALRNGSMLAIGGITQVWTGVGIAWLTVFPAAKKHPHALMNAAFEMLHNAAENLRLHRVHAEIKASDKKAKRVAKMLGFDYESTLKKYGPDATDYHMMTWHL
jgi:hypothetical protein